MNFWDRLLKAGGLEKVKKRAAGFMQAEVEAIHTPTIEPEKQIEAKDFKDAALNLPWTNAGVRAIAKASLRPELKIFREIKEGKEIRQVEVSGEEINELIEYPNKEHSQMALRYITVMNLICAGNAYWNLVGTREKQPISETNKPVELWWLKSEQLDIKPSKTANNFIDKYIYTTPTGKSQNIDPSEIIHFMIPNPNSYFKGLSMLWGIKETAITDFYAMAYNKNFMKNDATVPGLFTSDKEYSEEQGRRIVHDWEMRHKGPGRAGVMDFLFGGIHYEELGKTPKDAQYLELRKQNREEELANIDVPPSIVGLLEYANYSNMEVQQKKFWEDGVMPILNLIADMLTLKLAPLFNKDYWFAFDYSNIDVLQEDKERKARIANALISCGVKTPNQIRAEMYNDDPYEGGDNYYMLMSLIPVGADSQNKRKALTPKAEDKPSFWQTGTRKKILWEHFSRRVGAKERAFIPEVEKFLKNQAKEIKEKISEYTSLDDVRPAQVFNSDEEAKKYQDKFKNRYISSFKEAGEAGYSATKGILYEPGLKKLFKEEEFILRPEHIAQLEKIMNQSAKFFNDTTWEKILEQIRLAQQEAWTIEELAKNLEEKLDELSIGRSRLIAKTEMARVENYGQLEGYKQNEFVEFKGWLCSMLPTSRPSHIEADNKYSAEPILLNEPFIVDGQEMMFPGDTSMGADAGNVCNCLCATFPEVRNL